MWFYTFTLPSGDQTGRVMTGIFEGDIFFNIYNKLEQNIKIQFRNWLCILFKSFTSLAMNVSIDFTIMCLILFVVSVYTINGRNNDFIKF